MAAHTRSESFSTWTIDGSSVSLMLTVPEREATRIPWNNGEPPELAAHVASYVESRVSVGTLTGTPCTALGPPRPLRSSRGYLRLERRWSCPTHTGLELRDDAFFDVAPSHVGFARIQVDRAAPIEVLFTDAHRVWRGSMPGVSGAPEGSRETPAVAFVRFVDLGVAHILSGVDHLAFLLGVLLLCRRLGEVAFVVTGFTLGHSLTLGLAALGLARPDAAAVEALIGLTIALVAAENVAISTGAARQVAAAAGVGLGGLAIAGAAGLEGLPPRVLAGMAVFSTCYLELSASTVAGTRLRAAITALFGLIHGFGFANSLIEAGLPTGQLLPALLGFNLGVELGQLAVVAVVLLGAARLVRLRVAAPLAPLNELASAALCGLGLFWFISRGYLGG